MDAARAIDLCRTARNGSWGVLSAAYVRADGSPGVDARSHGLLSSFGSNVAPREGGRMLALSSGTARAVGDPGFMPAQGSEIGTQSAPPPGFPVSSPSCGPVQPGSTTALDPAGLQVTLRAPTNATSFAVDYIFYTYEYPEFVCDVFNDFFVILQSPAPAGSQFGNIAFDNLGNPVSVNNGYLEVCAPRTVAGKTYACPQGTTMLAGTGFDTDFEGVSHAATGWLTTQSPVQPGAEMTLRFAVWDAGDEALTSTVLVDNFRWHADAAPETPVTQPVPK
jgi:hypothetical protein